MINFEVYHNGHIGMCNALMSVENAVICASLKKESLNLIHGGYLFNSEKRLTLFDLYNINFDVVHNRPKNNNLLPHDLFHTAVYHNAEPTLEFLDGRTKLIDLKTISSFSTSNYNTLAFYSYLFHLDNEEKKLVKDLMMNVIKPKDKYLLIAMKIVEQLGKFNCINIRRGDYLTIPNNKNGSVEVSDFLPVIKNNFTNSLNLLIVTDEKNKDYFKDLSQHYNLIYIQDLLQRFNLDSAESGLVALIIASYSQDFIGTLKSTFSAVIQRKRKMNGFNENFKYLYPQNNIELDNRGQMLQCKNSPFSWSSHCLNDEYKSIAFWFREWKESYE